MLETWRFFSQFRLDFVPYGGELVSILLFLQVPPLSLLMTVVFLWIGRWLYEKKRKRECI